MKKFFALALSLAMALSLAACGSSGTASSGSAASGSGSGSSSAAAAIETVTPGELTVATSPDFAPYEFYAIGDDGKPTLAGFDMALAQYIADYMGLKLNVVPMDFDGVIMEVGMNNVDLGMAGLSPDPSRANAMDFSDIYYTGGQSLVTVKANADKYNSFEAINDPNVSVGAQTGSIQADLAQKDSPNASIIQLAKVTDIIAELLSGKLDAAYIETDVAKSYQVNYPDLQLVMDVPYDVEGSAIGVQKGNAPLMEAVNAAIAAAKADGSLEKFVADANAQASGNKYEGLLDENGNVKTDAAVSSASSSAASSSSASTSKAG
ncbi:Arginine-binding extracellular protein ArtP [bioreactor metagenome]|uniref:Arginine-binding extracellular protein ArtP n=1 Tax=bioreactor metagenome TaxID=1076179 RepID=A0A644Y2N8_9ZZZZ|nr:transporter substrate-binding domain-containing protein [Oscillibacter sp.]